MRLTAYPWTLWSPSFHKQKSLHVVIPMLNLWESCMMNLCCLEIIPSHSCQHVDSWLRYLPFWNPLSLFVGTVALEEDAQILRVIEAYCTGASLHQNTTGLFSLLSLRTAPRAHGDINPNFLVICVQRYGKSVSPKSCCQKKKRSLWRRWRAMDKQLLKKSKCQLCHWGGLHLIMQR